MKANELMIGDFLLGYDNKPLKVISIAEDGIYFDSKDGEGVSSFDNLSPIPLTPEILEKNGFEECIWGGKKSWRRRYLVHNEVLICIDGRDGGFKHFGYQGYESQICLFYVHELQHALRLCGIEKEIVL